MPNRRRVRAQVEVTRRVTIRTQQTVQRQVVPQVSGAHDGARGWLVLDAREDIERPVRTRIRIFLDKNV